MDEARPLITGRYLGHIFQVSRFGLALDFRLREGSYLLISAEPGVPRLHLISRRMKDLEKQSLSPGRFAQALSSNLRNAELVSITTHESERIVRLKFSGEDEIGKSYRRSLVAQLTGRSANLFLLDDQDVITNAIRPPKGVGQQPGELYQQPPGQLKVKANETTIEKGDFPSLSAAVVNYYESLAAAGSFAARVQAVRDRLRRQIAQREKLRSNLTGDLISHGEADQHKRAGDLLLANIANAKRMGAMARVKDYFSEGEPLVEIAVDEDKSLQEAAAHYFSRYTKSKRAKEEIARRVIQLERELDGLRQQQLQVEDLINKGDVARLVDFEEAKKSIQPTKRTDASANLPGVRRYRSSDGYEVLVGRTARTNDHLTFKVAKPHDLWLHAADYPGSHVVVRNKGRNEIPQRTMIEAAQLAAKFSQAGEDAKVNVHYAQRKFLSKPKGAAPGLVRMSTFKTIAVAPEEKIERI